MKTFIFLLLFCPSVYAESIPDSVAVQCLIGEAGNQGFQGMQAVGEVLRLRGSTRGLYGCKNPVFSHSSPKLREQALKAWKASKTSNLTKNATHFENVEAFGMPKWAKSMTRIIKIKNHTFFK